MDALRRRAVTMNSTRTNKKESKKDKKAKSRGGKGVTFDGDNVAGTEAGGITQVITAFEVPLPLDDSGEDEGGNKQVSTVTFLDTPGHAAFKKMRQSGSSATDVIVLVVAADDGVSPQTVEIIEMFKSIARSQPQSISLVVAVSKIDKHGIDIDEAVMRIENQLIEHEIFTENVLAGGGDEGEFGACQLFPVSGITGEGLDDLVEGLALQSELMDLRADYDARGEGIVIDARMEKGLGVVADCVIRWGKVEPGDFVVSGTHGGKVRFLNDVGNKPLKKARPSQPVRIVGFKSLPKAGDPIVIAASEDEAKELIRLRESELHNEDRAEFETDVKLQVMGTANKQGSMMQRAQEKYGFDNDDEGDNEIVIPVVIKADSHGALEAVRDALVSIGTDSKLNVVIDPVEMSTGVVTTSDVVLARESDAAIFSFGKVGVADKETRTLAEADEVSIRNHDIIYRLLEDAKEYFERYLPTKDVLVVHGKATVQAVFDVTDSNKKSVSVAGLRVTDGSLFKIKSKATDGSLPLPCFYRITRNGEVVMSEDEKLKAISLRKVKEDVDIVRRGDECGLGLDGFSDIKEGDIIECFSIEQKRTSL
jgi:translation initiation factor IF-2